ncbi:LapA family protein [Agaribacterium haliotis]|uniref:LapA family protein n=1 Tax=Agaribacterium haliotis TaxID=2013869 RepID=UPI000BB59125|nr:LapA family protein [Agaribacterium haliotis]
MAKLLRLIKRLSFVIIVLAALIAGAWFASENPDLVAPLLFGLQLPKLSLGLYFSACIAVGVLVAFCWNFVYYQRRILGLRAEIRSLKKSLRKAESELDATGDTKSDLSEKGAASVPAAADSVNEPNAPNKLAQPQPSAKGHG